MSVRFFKWSKGILGILRFFGGAEEMLGGVGRKTLSFHINSLRQLGFCPTATINGIVFLRLLCRHDMNLILMVFGFCMSAGEGNREFGKRRN